MDSWTSSAWDDDTGAKWEGLTGGLERFACVTPTLGPWLGVCASGSGFDHPNNDGFNCLYNTHSGCGGSSGSFLPSGFNGIPPPYHDAFPHTNSASYSVPFSTATPTADSDGHAPPLLPRDHPLRSSSTSSSVTWTEAGTPQCISPQGSSRDTIAQSSSSLSPSSFGEAQTVAPTPSSIIASSSRARTSFFPDAPSHKPNPMANADVTDTTNRHDSLGTPPGDVSGNPTKARKPSSRRLKPAAAAAATTEAKGKQPATKPAPASPSLDEYKDNIRQWHNRIGKKYRNKLNDKFENLHAILLRAESDCAGHEANDGEEEGIEGGAGDDNEPPGRTALVINKSNVLDMARRRIELLQMEREKLRAEKEALLEQLKM
ncbi:hypothetical protein B0T22DRAFT_472165 [Podospora appendiculata]|uniref:BHLH domain-containing protein n=1 Tax=Podospora appendiculata TaxID=314037 RepID=A0AAE1C8H7_9PEZI|nr:hypothetical protein B0T22DRAFT_472165 [Podospora appendiculata]